MGGKIIAVDLGGTNLRVSIVKNNKILKYVKKKTPENKEEIIEVLTETVKSLMSSDVKGIGVASPGPLKNGVIKETPNLNLRNFDLKGYLQKKFRVRVEIENDANCVAVAESKLGCKKKNFFILTLGTGIGGGVIINGKLYTGGEGYGGELGHIILDNGKNFEYLWQKTRKDCKKAFGKELMIKELLLMKSKKAKNILNQSSEYLGMGIASLINVFDPEVVILSGGMRDTGNLFLVDIKNYVKKYLLIPSKAKIKWTGLNHPGSLGAALLISEGV